jgi:uncharacterized protein (TIGR03790 family)
VRKRILKKQYRGIHIFWAVCIFLSILITKADAALVADEVLVVYNKNNPHSKAIADYYAHKRGVPEKNIFELDVIPPLADSISRDNYDLKIAGPIRERLERFGPNENIRCILLTYGVPYKVGSSTPTAGQTQQANSLTKQASEITARMNHFLPQIEKLGQDPRGTIPPVAFSPLSRTAILKYIQAQMDSAKKRMSKLPEGQLKEIHSGMYGKINDELFAAGGLFARLSMLNVQIDAFSGKETSASVDSELSMVMFSEYMFYRWQPNGLKGDGFGVDSITKMVCRLDGPDPNKIMATIDKSIAAEESGLMGVAYFDSRGLKKDFQMGSFGYFDNSVRKAADITRAAGIATIEEKTEPLFLPGQCPRTALYCGWYSVKKYVDAFDFVDGAIGYHIASWEAIDIHDANSTQWCPAMLERGISATFGAVAEPYLQAFPEPDKFFAEILNGACLVEAYYKTNPFNSWQMILIGDPLYRPYKNMQKSNIKM